MLREWIPHKQFQEKLRLEMMMYYGMQRSRVVDLDRSIAKLYLFNLDPLLPVVKPLYPDFGRPALNQQGIIRSLVLMLDQQVHSITKWARKVAADPLLASICGFEANNVPAPASYYDMLARYWQRNHKTRKAKLKYFTSKPRKKLKKGEKLAPKHPGIVKRLVEKALEGKLHTVRPEVILQKLIARCVVDSSAKMGILGNMGNFSVALDGSTFYSGASHYGIKVCDCRSKGVYDCKCARRFSDPDARWGWDSYREQWFFGNMLFNVTASDSPYDLPIHIKLVQASRHDSATAIFALLELKELYPLITFKQVVADGAMDNYPFYDLLRHFNMLPFITLDARTKAKFHYPHPDVPAFDDQGQPLCHAGIPFAYWGRCKPYRLKYRCWFAAKGLEPPKECRCSDSQYGKTIYLKSDDDPRMFTPVPRNTKAFKKKFKTRTTVERAN